MISEKAITQNKPYLKTFFTKLSRHTKLYLQYSANQAGQKPALVGVPKRYAYLEINPFE